MILHFLRPLWLITLPLLVILSINRWQKRHAFSAWKNVCDNHLLEALAINHQHNNKHYEIFWLLGALFFITIALAGPCWFKMPTPTYHTVAPRVILLDMSQGMQETDLKPNRLTRAKFKLHDILTKESLGQFALIAYTGEPFVVSPLTEDGKTIDALLDSLTPDIIPVDGSRLDSALDEAKNVFKEAHFNQGQILVLTSTPPDALAIEKATALAKEGYQVSILPMTTTAPSTDFFTFSDQGKGQVIPFSNASQDIDNWLQTSKQARDYALNTNTAFSLWRDEGRWFIFPALLCLIPVFRRGWLQRVSSC